MKLQRVSKFFGNVYLEGWDHVNLVWVKNVVRGTFQVYDRFISARTFGQKKRIFIAHKDWSFDWEKYQTVRDESGLTHIIESVNMDIGGMQVAEEYLHVFMLHEALFSAKLFNKVTVENNAGYRSNASLEEVGDFWCDMERYTSDTDKEQRAVKYSGVSFFLPKCCPVTEDSELVVDGKPFDVQEVSPMLLINDIRALERGHG